MKVNLGPFARNKDGSKIIINGISHACSDCEWCGHIEETSIGRRRSVRITCCKASPPRDFLWDRADLEPFCGDFRKVYLIPQQ